VFLSSFLTVQIATSPSGFHRTPVSHVHLRRYTLRTSAV
jgi:hypothetical protein